MLRTGTLNRAVNVYIGTEFPAVARLTPCLRNVLVHSPHHDVRVNGLDQDPVGDEVASLKQSSRFQSPQLISIYVFVPGMLGGQGDVYSLSRAAVYYRSISIALKN